jgi:hypothetical protein
MSKHRKSFIDLCLQGKAVLDEIDDYVEAWHEKPEGKPLCRYLGMKRPEYSLWIRDPDSLAYIIKARREQRPLTEVINHSYKQSRIAAGSGDNVKIERLRAWLKEQGELVE